MPAFAVTRTAYFTQAGRNTSTEGFGWGVTVQGNCRITISNPSSIAQDFTLVVNASVANGSTQGTGASSSPNCGSTGSNTYSCSRTNFAAGASETFVFNFPAYPASVAGFQLTTCSGSITANDPSTNPGFLLASGNMLTFSESGALQTQNVTGGTTRFGGQAVYTQIPISINRGKPF